MTRLLSLLAAFFLASSIVVQSADIVTMFSTNATWRLFKGRTEASAPDLAAWRTGSFDDTAFTSAPAPFTYGEGYTYGTDMSDMLNQYTCFFLRRTFEVTNKASLAALRFGAKVDDGFVVWINGAEVLRVNMPGVTGDPVTIATLSTGAPSEPVPFDFYTFLAPANYLVNGTNVIAIQVFNVSSGSSDLVFDCSLSSVSVDVNPPTIVSVTPPPGSSLSVLTQLTVRFSEPITGLSADDLNVHGIGATGLSGSGDNYIFTFNPAPYGNVPITWVSAHGIVDLAVPANAFDETQPGATWSYTIVDNVAPTIASLFPPAGATVQTLGQIQVNFNESVGGVNAADLLMNGQPATNLIVQPAGGYIFQFAPPANGIVSVGFASGHGITDLAPAANPFAGGSWNYNVNPNATFTGIVINEINAANETGLRDEDGDEQDWIELYNGSSNAVDLAGWSLSDDEDEPGRWVFPSRLLAPGQYLVVFASGKDRKTPVGTNLFHTSFKLSSDREFLGLFTPDSPRQLAAGFPSITHTAAIRTASCDTLPCPRRAHRMESARLQASLNRSTSAPRAGISPSPSVWCSAAPRAAQSFATPPMAASPPR
jgi:hypothetical protein